MTMTVFTFTCLFILMLAVPIRAETFKDNEIILKCDIQTNVCLQNEDDPRHDVIAKNVRAALQLNEYEMDVLCKKLAADDENGNAQYWIFRKGEWKLDTQETAESRRAQAQTEYLAIQAKKVESVKKARVSGEQEVDMDGESSINGIEFGRPQHKIFKSTSPGQQRPDAEICITHTTLRAFLHRLPSVAMDGCDIEETLCELEHPCSRKL